MEPHWAVFEAAMLVQVAEPARDRRPVGSRFGLDPPGDEPPGLLAEFDSAAAAQRLLSTASALLPTATVESGYRGGRHRYEIHRVIAEPELVPAVRNALAESAAVGVRALWARSTQATSSRQSSRTRRVLSPRGTGVAVAAWRGALLAAGPGRGGNDQIALRVGDPGCARALVTAAALLKVPIRALARPGGQLISVTGAAAVDALVDLVTGNTGVPAIDEVGMAV
jgi:hypothetical protein